MGSNVERCIADILGDLERQGGLDAEDVDRAIDRHNLGPPELALVFAKLSELDIAVDARTSAGSATSLAGVGDDMSQIMRSASAKGLLTAAEEVSLGRRIRIGQLALESLETQPGSGLAIKAAVADGKVAHDQLVLSNLRLVISIAKRYGGHGLDLADLVQEGTIGLMRAADKFDHTLGFKFSTYATWWVRQSMTRAISDKARIIRLPVHAEEALAKIKASRNALETELRRRPTIDEIAARVQFEPDKVKSLLRSDIAPLSLDMNVADSDTELAELLNLYAEPVDETVFAILASEELQAALNIVAAHLDTTASGARVHGVEMLRLKYGLVDGETWTLDRIGEKFEVTRERVRQIIQKTLKSDVLIRAFSGFDPTKEIEG